MRRSMSTTRARASGGSPAKSPSKKRPEWQSLEQSSPRKSLDVEAEMKRARARVEARQKQMCAPPKHLIKKTLNPNPKP